MPITVEANILDTLSAFSSASDLAFLRFVHHSTRVTYLSMLIGEAIGLQQEELDDLFLAALLHDIGVSSSVEKSELVNIESDPALIHQHCAKGHKLLSSTNLFSHLADVILFHHSDYQDHVPLLARIIHLADRIDVFIERENYILWQVEKICHHILSSQKNRFDPQVVKAFMKIKDIPSVWLDLETGNYGTYLRRHARKANQNFTIDELEEIAHIFSTIIDDKSPYTANHSKGVAHVAVGLGSKAGLSKMQLKMLEMAGCLHDLGKLAVPDQILLSPNKLTPAERQVMTKHTYLTYHLIGAIGKGIDAIQKPAAYHHEHLDGSGYPFRLKAPDLDLPSRVMAVADIFQALTEERPYRPALPRKQVISILTKAAKLNHIDSELTDLAISNMDQLRFTQLAVAK